MRISLIIPCYKNASTLARAINSVLGQSRQVNEIIVVNDASPESKDIERVIRTYPQIRYIVNSRNIGLAATRNVGAAAATSELVCFLDADDELHPQKIEFQCKLFREGIAVSCDNLRFNDENDLDIKFFSSDFTTSTYKTYLSIIFRNTITGASILISREDFTSIGGYDESLRACEDWDFSIRLLRNGYLIKNVNLPLYFYRYSENSLSNDFRGILNYQSQVVRKHLYDSDPSRMRSFIADLFVFFHVAKCSRLFDLRSGVNITHHIYDDICDSIHNFVLRFVMKQLLQSKFFAFITKTRRSK